LLCSASATVVGASTLLGKGSQSLAPMFGFRMLEGAGGDRVWMLKLLVLVPLVCVVVQGLLWREFSLRGRYLKLVVEHARGVSV